jgi:hydroxymethylbilane synthase
MTTKSSLVFATRPSDLARWQTGYVIQLLQAAWPGLSCQQEVITTSGDRILDKPLPEIGGKGLFTQELEAELLSGRVDAAVHSLKDLPVADSPGLIVGSIPARADARDVLISAQGYTLKTLPQGAHLGTSSLRRSAQLLALRPDLQIASLRGNVNTRVRKALQGQYDAIVLASAGVTRLGLDQYISEWLSFDIMLPAPGQGALAVQCRAEDAEVLKILAGIEDPATRTAVQAERAFLEGLGGGCSLPVAAYARSEAGRLHLDGLVASLDGKRLIRLAGQGDDPISLGKSLARQALAQGAGDLLAAISARVR